MSTTVSLPKLTDHQDIFPSVSRTSEGADVILTRVVRDTRDDRPSRHGHTQIRIREPLPTSMRHREPSLEASKGLTPSDPSSTSSSVPSTSPPTPSASPGPIVAMDTPIGDRIPRAHARPAWMPSWRWVVAVVILAILGRLSTLAGW